MHVTAPRVRVALPVLHSPPPHLAHPPDVLCVGANFRGVTCTRKGTKDGPPVLQVGVGRGGGLCRERGGGCWRGSLARG